MARLRQMTLAGPIVLAAAAGVPNNRIAAEAGVSPMTVLLLWRRRFEREDRDRVIALTLSPPLQGPGRGR